MAKASPRRSNDPTDGLKDWMRQRSEAVAARMSPNARALGHELFRAAIRSGVAASMPTPMAVAVAGAQALMGDRRARPPATRGPPPPQPARQAGRPLVANLAAGARGASDAFTFGLGDHLGAGISAAGGMIDGHDFRTGYEAGMARARAQDAEDWKLHPLARVAGEVAGTGASLAVTSPLALGRVAAGGARMAALADAPRLKGAAGLVGREVAALTGLGAANGVVGQVMTDSLLQRRSSPADFAGAAVGGAAGTVGLIATRRPQASAALGGAVTSASQDLLGGRPISVDEAFQSAALSGATGGLVGAKAASDVNRLRPAEKGRLGERMSETRSRIRGDAPREGPKPRVSIGGGKVAIPDHQTGSGLYVEAKFGPSARLSGHQTKAFSLDPEGFRLDHFLPQDVGAVNAAIASNLAMTASRPRPTVIEARSQNKSKGR